MARNFRLGDPLVAQAGNAPATPKRTGPVVLYTALPVAKKDVTQYRRWADQNEWIRAAINHRKTQISGAPWDIGTIDPSKPTDEAIKLLLIGLFSRPNTKTDSFRLLIEPIIEDILVLDAGCVEIVRSVRGFPVQMWPVDAAWIRLDPTWDGDPAKFRYFWYPQGRLGASLLDQDLIYMMANPSSHRVVGLSPLETLKETIDAEIAAARYNKSQVIQAPPSGIIDLGEDATPDNIDQFEQYWRAEIAGYKATAVVGGTKNMKFVPFGQSNRDMQFLQWQTYLIRKIAAVFQMSPQDLGILFDVNRANATVQAELSEDRGLRPLISLVESHFNREVVGEFARMRAKQAYWRGHIPHETMRLAMGLSWLDPTAPQIKALYKQAVEANVLNLYFKFRIPSGRSARSRADIHRLELSGIPYTTINEVREEELKDGVEGGDEIIVPTPIGPIRLSVIQGSLPPSPAEQKFLERLLQEPPLLLGTGHSPATVDQGEEE
jgi:HK97 family phage portal protein